MSATREDVPEVKTETGIEASNNPRVDDIERIAAENHRRMTEELGIEEEETPAIKVEQEVKQIAPHLLDEDALASMRVKTKVDGIEEEHSIADLVKSYQKDSAASRRLEEASRRQREIEAREADLLAREAALTQHTEKPSQERDAILSEAVSALYEGDEEKTKEAFGKLFAERETATTQQEKPIDPAVIANDVREQIRFESALEQLKEDHPNIVADPYLIQVADAYLSSEMEDGKDIAEAMRLAGVKTQEWLQQKLSGTKTPDNKTDEKLERKKALDNLQAANIKQGREDAETETSPQAASNVIAEMRKARGLPV